ncbi:MAG: DNA methyltransferase [Candidatus Hodarchaeales archaeon]
MTSKMIENEFPVLEISQLAIPERSSYKPIYQISKWFARRSSATFRAILLSTNYSKPDNFMDKFYNEDSLSKVTILDPFMGGGTTIIEALRLGMNCIGIDINPVAWFITKTECDLVDINLLTTLITKCEEELAESVKKWYTTTCPVCSKSADIIYTHWVKEITCTTCHARVPMFRDFVIAYIANEVILLCPSCFTSFNSSSPLKNKIKCPECDYNFLPKNGYRKGRNVCICSDCGNSIKIIRSIRSEKKLLPSKAFAIEGFCPHCFEIGDKDSQLAKSRYKFIKSVSKADIDLYQEAVEYWDHNSQRFLWPTENIPIGSATKVLYNHKYTNWFELFNGRQLLALSTILTYIQKINDIHMQEMFLAAFINLLNHNNVFTRYSPKGQKVEGIFARHDFHPLSTYAENNVWGTKYGRGTWKKCLKRLINGKKYNIAPYNFKRVNEEKKIVKKKKVISGKIDGKMFEGNITDFPAANSNLLLLCQDSEDIPDFKKPVDLIISDPPYADNVNYSELSDFLYVWIRIILKEKYRFFAPLETPKIGEAIESSRKHMDYYKKLTTIFRNCRKQLKPGGLFVFTFHHSDPDTWFKIGEVLNFACFHTVRTYAIPSEAPNVLNIKNKKGVSYDLIIVCKEIMDRQKQEIKKLEFMKLLKQKYFDRLKSYREERIAIAGIDVIVVFFGEFFELSSKLQPIDNSGKALKFSIITKECKALFETLTKNIR